MNVEKSARYKRVLNVFDVCFGSYSIALALLSIFFYFNSSVNGLTCGLFVAFPVANLILSQISLRVKNLFYVEFVRLFIMNSTMSAAIYSFSNGPLADFWHFFVITSISGGVFVLTWTEKKVAAYLQILFWISIICISNTFFALTPLPLAVLMREKITFFALSALIIELVGLVNQTLARETETKAQLFHNSKLSALGEMAAGVAHEINNPLAIINISMRVMSKMAKKGHVDIEELKDTIKDVEATVKRVTSIVSGLRNLSRNSSEEDFVPCRVIECIDDVLSVSAERFRVHEIDIEILVDEKVKDIQIKCLRVQLSQVFLNLLNNAYDAVEPLKEKWIKISIEDRGGVVAFRIVDSGKGIPDPVAQKIFNPFYTTKDIGKGTGLGLSLSSSIVAKHGGVLKLDRSNSHTCFTFELQKAA